MARPLRIEYPGAFYHVMSRGNAKMDICHDDADRAAWLATLGDTVLKFQWTCYAYCLMDNHYHLLVETPQGNLARSMRHLNGVYTQRFNRAHGRVGHLYQGRYKAILVERDAYLAELCRYIALNPTTARHAAHPGDYLWSSYRYAVGKASPPEWLANEALLDFFGGKKKGKAALKRFVEGESAAPSPLDSVKNQLMLGSEQFIKEMGAKLEEAGNPDIYRPHRLANRPTLEELLDASATGSKAARDQAIKAAHRTHGYTLNEIGRKLGLHYATVGRIAREGGKLG